MGIDAGRWADAIVTVRRGDIWQVSFDPVRGSEQAKTRPALVVQRDSANAASPTTIVCPLVDARGQRGNLLNVLIHKGDGGTTKDSLIACNQVRVVDLARFRGNALGKARDETLRLVDDGLRAILDL